MKKQRKKIQTGVAFERYLAQEFPTPEARAAFEADVEAKIAAAQALAAVEQHRVRSRVSQATVAQRMGTPASVLSRLTHAEHPNPTFATMGKALASVGLAATIRVHKARSGEPTLKVVTTR
jgi:hypothetical protein